MLLLIVVRHLLLLLLLIVVHHLLLLLLLFCVTAAPQSVRLLLGDQDTGKADDLLTRQQPDIEPSVCSINKGRGVFE